MGRDREGRLVVTGNVAWGYAEADLGGGLRVARYMPDGTLDPSFGSMGLAGSGLEASSGMTIQADGKVVVAGFTNWGHSADINHKYSFAVTRLNADGSPDRGFGGVREDFTASAARDVVSQSNGRLVAVGLEAPYFKSIGVVLAHKPNGRVDRSFGKRGRVSIFAPRSESPTTDLSDVVALPDDRLLIAGALEGRILLVRLLANGRPDPSFGGGDGRVAVQFTRRGCSCSGAHAVRVQSDGRIVVVAHEEPRLSATGVTNVVVTRFFPDGRLDRSFGPEGEGFVRYPDGFALGLAIEQDDGLVVAGHRGSFERGHFLVLRYGPDGRPDPSFGRGGALVQRLGEQSEATSALVQPDGRIVVAGHRSVATADGDVRAFVLERFLP